MTHMNDKVFINLSNHPTKYWDNTQIEEALKFGDIVDITFPDIDEAEDEKYIRNQAKIYYNYILKEYADKDITVHVMGEMNFTYTLVKLLQENGIRCVASTSKRIVKENTDGYKEVYFRFIKFRYYE